MAGDDMGNGADAQRMYNDALTAQLGERVTNLNRRQSDLESEMRSGFKAIESSMSAMSTEMRSSVAGLTTTISERNKPQWQAIAVALSFCTIVGGLVYWPINSSTSRLENALATIADKMVTQKELEYRTSRGAEDRSRMEASIKKLDDDQVPRAEHARAWQNYDQRLMDQQRQVDEVKQALGGIYGTRDALLDLRSRLDRVEREKQGKL
jgi:DNA repair exonuclease SbcCD ATPase subunit